MSDPLNDPAVRRKVAVLRHVDEVRSNVAMTCRYFGISRQLYYTWLRRYRAEGLVRQPQLVIFEALSLVVALFRSCLVDPSPGGPVVGVVARVDGVAQGGPEAPDFVAGQGNEVLDVACGVPF